ncbi:hypothetical protein [Nocardioides sp. 503]|uniref:hypothetical protein n=1 Tax=Nocardioides sp. 503 TaxID=2508326 RepID=UPI00106F1B8F|nr:hypothetical protein [Nocardioides sp. 503]
MRLDARPAAPAAIAAVLLVLAGCGTSPLSGAPPGEDAPERAAAAGGWTRLPDSPLSAREGPVAEHVETADRDLVVVVGGYVGRPCPPNADCTSLPRDTASDGAAYDLDEQRWVPIADAPRPVSSFAPTAVVGDTLYVLIRGHLLSWDAGDDAWRELEKPGASDYVDLEAAGELLVVSSGSDENGIRPDRTYDAATDTWVTLPADPLKPSYDRVLVPTTAGLVLTAKRLAAVGGPEDPAIVRAALLPTGAQRWRVLPPATDQLGGWSWAWTGTRLVDATPGGADGGEVNGYGRTIPYGGALDPVTGTWTALEDAPEAFTGGWPVRALGGRRTATDGWVYDDGARDGSGRGWTRLRRPPGAPSEPGPGVWVRDTLLVVGGADWDDADDLRVRSAEDVWSTGLWAWRAG